MRIRCPTFTCSESPRARVPLRLGDGRGRIRDGPADLVPKFMQLLVFRSGGPTDHDQVSSVVSFELELVKPRNGMQRLMDIAHEMQEPHEVIGLHVVGGGRGFHGWTLIGYSFTRASRYSR